jgi:uncharacterized protein DUF6616
MPYYIEQWRPRPKWLSLTPEDRGKFLFDLSPTIQGLIDAGIELVGYMVRDAKAGQGSDFSFLRIWKLQDKDSMQRIEEALRGAGWGEFFEPGSWQGEILTPQVAIPHLVGL